MTSTQGRQSEQSDIREHEASLAKQVIAAEIKAIEMLPIDGRFHEAVELIVNRVGPGLGGAVVVSGLGKSGLIGQKISATLASTGTPSHFMHPAEAFHGDLGRVRQDDVVLLLSYGGATDEVVRLASHLKQDGVAMIAMVRSRGTELGRLASVVLELGEIIEACPFNVAPTASTTAMLALGDALAMCVSQRRSFGVEDFHKYHPGGSLGRELTPVYQALRFKAGENLPLIPKDKTLEQAYEMATTSLPNLRRAGAMLIVDEAGRLAGIFTDGDLVRLLLKDAGAMQRPIEQVMIADPVYLRADAKVREAVQIMRERRIDELPVVDSEKRPVGLLDVQDLVTMKVVE